MARYSTFKYGAEKYGSTLAAGELLWGLLIDWDADGNFYEGNEALRMSALSLSRGRDYYVNPGGKGLEHMRPGRAVMVLDNEDGRFDPFNPSSPIYPDVTPGKFARLFVKDGDDGTTYQVMRGVVEDVQPISGDDKVRITIVDGLQWLKDQEIIIGLEQVRDISDPAGSIMTDILDDVGWPATSVGHPTNEWGIDLDLSITRLRYYWAWQQNALDAINELEEAELGVFFHAKDGDATFRSRHHQGSVVDTLTQDEVLRAIVVPQPWEVIRNEATVYAYPKTSDSNIDDYLWELDEIIPIAIGETVTVYAPFKWNGQSVAGGDLLYYYNVNSASDGSGVNLSGDCTHVNGEAGGGVQLSLTNNSAHNGYIISWQVGGLYADAIYAHNPALRKASDASSQGKYGIKGIVIDTPWQEDPNVAQNYAEALIEYLKDPNYFPVVQVEDRPSIQYGLELYDRVILDLDKLGIDGDYRLAKIEHQWLNENGNAVRTTFKFEPYIDLSGYWQFTTNIGVTSVFGF